jgi:tetratricopeptide (TPR) repeat protein
MGITQWLNNKKTESETESSITLSLRYLKRAEMCKDENERKHDISMGLRVLTEEIKEHPDQPVLYYGRGNLFISAGDYESARKDLERVPLNDEKIIKKAKGQGVDLIKDVNAHLTFLNYSLGDYDKAAKGFLKTRVADVPEELLQSPELIHFAKGCMFDANKRPGDAKNEFLKVLEISPNLDSEALREFSWFPSKDNFLLNLSMNEYNATKSAADATKYCERALKINPHNTNAKVFLNQLKKQHVPLVKTEKKEKEIVAEKDVSGKTTNIVKTIIGTALAAGVSYLGSELIGDSIARAVFPLNPASALMFDNTLKLMITGGSTLAAYQILRESEKEAKIYEPNKHEEKKYRRAESIRREVETLEKIREPLLKIEKKGEGDYRIGKEASGKTAENALSNYMIKLTGGRSSVRPIPGRESYCMSDIMSGRLASYEKFLEKRPEISSEPPLVRAAIFSRDVMHEKVDVEEVRKKVLFQGGEIKKSNENKTKPVYAT